MTKVNLVISKAINHQKIQSDMEFLKKFIDFARAQNWRVVVSGGYGLDGHLGLITRSHADLDVIIYGQDNRHAAESNLKIYLTSQIREVQITVKQEPFYLELDLHADNFVGNLYYVQTVLDPNVDLSQVKKSDGSFVTNSPDDFPPPIKGKLGDLTVEVQDQNAHLADILRRRGYDKSLSKHDQDITNIQLHLSSTNSPI